MWLRLDHVLKKPLELPKEEAQSDGEIRRNRTPNATNFSFAVMVLTVQQT